MALGLHVARCIKIQDVCAARHQGIQHGSRMVHEEHKKKLRIRHQMTKLGDKCFELLKGYIQSHASVAILSTFSFRSRRSEHHCPPSCQHDDAGVPTAQNLEGSGRGCCNAEAPTRSFARIALASVVSMVSFSSCSSAFVSRLTLLNHVQPLVPGKTTKGTQR